LWYRHISPGRFKSKLWLPKTVKKNKEDISKKDIIKILNNCSDIRLKTYVMLLAAKRMNVEEASYFSIKNDFASNPVRIHIRGENTKPK
jgi:hypothetical protein